MNVFFWFGSFSHTITAHTVKSANGGAYGEYCNEHEV